MDAVDVNKDEGKFNIKRFLIILLIVIPLLIGTFFYWRNPSFKRIVNRGLEKLPGPVGTYFKNIPTSAEKKERIDYLSNYFLSLDPGVSADKLYIIKQDDERLYLEIIKGMNFLSPEDTESVVLKVRDIEMRKDLLTSAYDDALEDKKNSFLLEVSRIQGQDLNISAMEMERKFSSPEFQEILAEVSVERLGEIFYYTDPSIRSYIMDGFEPRKRMDIEFEISKISDEKDALVNLAKYYETKPVEEIREALGSTDEYEYHQLATIYRNMFITKSAEVLAGIEDNEFIQELFASIILEDKLLKVENQLTGNISQAMEFLIEYNSKIEKLSKSYSQMNPSNVGKIAVEMMKNDSTITIFNFSMYENYELSDKIIIIDILSELKRDQLAKVLDSMKAEEASKLTELLAKPKERMNMLEEGGETIDNESSVIENQ